MDPRTPGIHALTEPACRAIFPTHAPKHENEVSPPGSGTANCTIARRPDGASPFGLVLSQNKKNLHREGPTQHPKMRVRPAGKQRRTMVPCQMSATGHC